MEREKSISKIVEEKVKTEDLIYEVEKTPSSLGSNQRRIQHCKVFDVGLCPF